MLGLRQAADSRNPSFSFPQPWLPQHSPAYASYSNNLVD